MISLKKKVPEHVPLPWVRRFGRVARLEHERAIYEPATPAMRKCMELIVESVKVTYPDGSVHLKTRATFQFCDKKRLKELVARSEGEKTLRAIRKLGYGTHDELAIAQIRYAIGLGLIDAPSEGPLDEAVVMASGEVCRPGYFRVGRSWVKGPDGRKRLVVPIDELPWSAVRKSFSRAHGRTSVVGATAARREPRTPRVGSCER